MRSAILPLLMILTLCSTKNEELQKSSEFRIKILLSSSKGQQNIYLKLCNATNSRFYLPNFHSLEAHLQIFKYDSSSNKYFDFRSIFNSIAMQEALNSISQERVFPNQQGKDHFADIMARELSKNVKDEGNYDSDLVGDLYEEFYSSLISVKYASGLECTEETVDLSPIKNEKGKYKVFFEYTAHPIPLKESAGSHMYRFYQDRMPTDLKGYKRWEGKIVSDTLELNIK